MATLASSTRKYRSATPPSKFTIAAGSSSKTCRWSQEEEVLFPPDTRYSIVSVMVREADDDNYGTDMENVSDIDDSGSEMQIDEQMRYGSIHATEAGSNSDQTSGLDSAWHPREAMASRAAEGLRHLPGTDAEATAFIACTQGRAKPKQVDINASTGYHASRSLQEA
jgi:hypothetical protein